MSLRYLKKFQFLQWGFFSTASSFNSDTYGFKSGRQVAVRYYVEKLSIPFVFNKLRGKTYFRFSFESPSWIYIYIYIYIYVYIYKLSTLQFCYNEEQWEADRVRNPYAFLGLSEERCLFATGCFVQLNTGNKASFFVCL